jgi:predicted nucleic acid-binding protein
MYVLDTNVISEMMKETRDAAVAAWLRACPVEATFTTTISQAKILYGVRRLPQSRRRHRSNAAAEAMFALSFADRILPFDAAAASTYADVRIARERTGLPIAQEDGTIAAIARVAGATVVTRDQGGFAGCGVPVVDPWRQA